MLTPNGIPCALTKEYVPPVRIVAKSENTENAEFLLNNRNPQAAYGTAQDCMCCTGEGYVILDFGCELCGGVRIISHRILPDLIGRVRLRFGESVGETCAQIGEKNATFHHAVRDMEVQIPNLSDQEWGNTGFRFLRIDFIDSQTTYTLSAVYAAATYRNLPYTGNFSCDDPLLNDIYITARRTVHLNMQNRLWDGIKRDRLVWVGDMQPEISAITDIFGQDECAEQSLLESVEKNPLPCWLGAIPAYSVWLLQILYDYCLKTGKIGFVKQFLPYAEGILQQLDRCCTDNGSIDFTRCEAAKSRDGFFFDWQTCGTPDAVAGNRFLFVFALNNFKRLYGMAGIPAHPLCDVLLKKLRAHTETDVKAKQVIALGILSGCLPAERYARRLTEGGAKGLSTFMSYFILSAVAQTSGVKKALDILKEYYGGMLLRGATSFWEDFDVEWLQGSGRIDELTPEGLRDLHGDYGRFCYEGYRHSLCHGWSCGPVQFITEYVLGITVKEAGCKALEITPDLGDLQSCKGSFPTPYGKVEITCKKDKYGNAKTKIKAPKAVCVTVRNA